MFFFLSIYIFSTVCLFYYIFSISLSLSNTHTHTLYFLNICLQVYPPLSLTLQSIPLSIHLSIYLSSGRAVSEYTKKYSLSNMAGGAHTLLR